MPTSPRERVSHVGIHVYAEADDSGPAASWGEAFSRLLEERGSESARADGQ
jgi:hypothetical protein